MRRRKSRTSGVLLLLLLLLLLAVQQAKASASTQPTTSRPSKRPAKPAKPAKPAELAEPTHDEASHQKEAGLRPCSMTFDVHFGISSSCCCRCFRLPPFPRLGPPLITAKKYCSSAKRTAPTYRQLSPLRPLISPAWTRFRIHLYTAGR